MAPARSSNAMGRGVKALIAAGVASAMLAGCGGGASVPLPRSPALAPAAAAAKAPQSQAQIALLIPAGRKPAYVSPSTAGVRITIYAAVAGPASGVRPRTTRPLARRTRTVRGRVR